MAGKIRLAMIISDAEGEVDLCQVESKIESEIG